MTLPERYDFFLVSQSVRQGTVNPTSYNVIQDDIGKQHLGPSYLSLLMRWFSLALKPDQLQKLTYKLTHLYYNWPGTVRVPQVCQYAHKVSSLITTFQPSTLSFLSWLFWWVRLSTGLLRKAWKTCSSTSEKSRPTIITAVKKSKLVLF